MLSIEFPTKRIAVGALIRDQIGRLLLVKPAYRDGWLVPGGVVDANESPRAGLCRELREELNLVFEPGRLLCVDYVSAHGDFADGMHLLFDGGHLADSLVKAISVCDPELHALQWVTDEEAQDLLVPSLARRVRSLLQAKTSELLYMENGEQVSECFSSPALLNSI